MTQFYTHYRAFVRAAGFGGEVAVDSRSAPVFS